MFKLITIKENVNISPKKIQSNFMNGLKINLNQKYANKVIMNRGLVICIWDIVEAGDPYVLAGEGNAWCKCTFRVVVWRPFVGEVLEGKIRSCSIEEGIRCSLEFFDDIMVPPPFMQKNTIFDSKDGVWCWNYKTQVNDSDDGGEESITKMYLDVGEPIRFRVVSVEFTEKAPIRKDALMSARAATLAGLPQEENVVLETPFKVNVSINEDGLGLIKWWQ